MRFLKLFTLLLLVSILTILTQVGGLVLLLSMLVVLPLRRMLVNRWSRLGVRLGLFLIVYLIFTFVLVPIVARKFGRVPLPVSEDRNVRPGNVLTCLLNRHYVALELRQITFRVAAQMEKRHPGAKVVYLDANFPFINGFPLLPHLSHNDGRKLDLSFQYNDRNTHQILNDIPSFIGYGICEEPAEGEENKPRDCASKGYWQYSLLREVVSQKGKERFSFDHKRTNELVNLFAIQEGIGKIFIEPHLRTRLGLTSNKIRFHGCQAVRHDDHIHVQLK